MAYSYRCRDYPGNEACPATFTAETKAEVMRHVELHGAIAHGDDPQQWSPEDRQQVEKLVRKSELPEIEAHEEHHHSASDDLTRQLAKNPLEPPTKRKR